MQSVRGEEEEEEGEEVVMEEWQFNALTQLREVDNAVQPPAPCTHYQFSSNSTPQHVYTAENQVPGTV